MEIVRVMIVWNLRVLFAILGIVRVIGIVILRVYFAN